MNENNLITELWRIARDREYESSKEKLPEILNLAERVSDFGQKSLAFGVEGLKNKKRFQMGMENMIIALYKIQEFGWAFGYYGVYQGMMMKFNNLERQNQR